MPERTTPPTPRYRRQKAKPHHRAFVELNGRRHYLGIWKSPESLEQYDRLVAEWLSNGRRAPVDVQEITVVEVCARYWEHATEYYRRPDGTSTSTLHKCRMVIRPLKQYYGATPAAQFGPLALRAIRQSFIDAGMSRNVINQLVGWVRRIFRWAVSQQLIPAEILTALTSLDPLRRGRSQARESTPVTSVPDDRIDAIRPFVNAQVWAMIELQRLSGPRPEEVVLLRALDINSSGDVWRYVRPHHKTSHHGHDRTIYFGQRAQAILKPFMLDRPIDQPLFSPAEAETQRRATQHAKRKTPLSAGNSPGTNKSANPVRPPKNHYTTDSYRRAIERACDQAFPPPAHLARGQVKGRRGYRSETDEELQARLGLELWGELQAWFKQHRWHPNQLRHGCATYFRQEFGIEVAQTILGHRMGSKVTEVYAESNVKKALDAIREVG